VYLAAGVDWFSRRILAWRLSVTMDVSFCIEAVEEALMRYSKPEIFNTDQGSQFTSQSFTCVLAENGIAIISASVTNWAVIAALIDQPTTRRENRSTTAAT
jgi:putative transposase